MNRELINSLPFEIEARVPIQLGRESISSSMVAVSELVKNAYDADAEHVIVQFNNLGHDTALLMISDNGDGMDLNLIKKYWLRIGTDCKNSITRSTQKRRILTGAKGLGRLGIDRLCHKLILQTKRKGTDHFFELHIEWEKYEQTGHSLSDILHDIYRVKLGSEDDFGQTFTDKKSKGTRMIMIGLKDSWDQNFLLNLRQELSLLLSPFGAVNDFKISLITGIKDIDSALSPTTMLDAAQWIVKAELDEDEQITITASSPKFSEKHTLGPHPWSEWIKDRGLHPDCGPFSFEMYFIPRDPSTLKRLDFSFHAWTEFMTANSGVRIYRDDFRVRPYGDPSGKGDWLDLGLRRTRRPEAITQKGWVVGPLQVVGEVIISRLKNPELNDQTNREGIVEGEGFFDLRAALLKVIGFFEQKAHESAVQRKVQKPSEQAKEHVNRTTKQAREKITNLHERIKDATSTKNKGKEDSNLSDLLSTVSDVASTFEEAIKATDEKDKLQEEETKILEADKDTLANLASLGILAVCFGHEAKEYTNLAASNAKKIQNYYEKGILKLNSPYDNKFSRSLDIIGESTDFIRTFSGFALGNIRPDKRKRKHIQISVIIHDIFNVFAKSLERQNITVNLPGNTDKISPIRAFQIDLESIIINLLTNSITAMVDIPAEKRIINISLQDENGDVVLSFADSGCGLEEGTDNRIFDPMFSTKRDRKGNVEGTGMGLSIVKTFVEDHCGGAVTAKSPGTLGGAEIEIRIPAIILRNKK